MNRIDSIENIATAINSAKVALAYWNIDDTIRGLELAEKWLADYRVMWGLEDANVIVILDRDIEVIRVDLRKAISDSIAAAEMAAY